jgi:hypothetical protein
LSTFVATLRDLTAEYGDDDDDRQIAANASTTWRRH